MIPASYRKLGVEPDNGKPIFAVLRIGKKHGQRGYPIDSDKFYIVQPGTDQREFSSSGGKAYKAPFRPEHPAFAAFHKRDDRKTFRGILPYRDIHDCWTVERRAKEIPEHPSHPDLFVSCRSKDGETAERLFQIGNSTAKAQPPKNSTAIEGKPDDEVWFKIDCPGSLCEHAQQGRCTTRAWLYFVAKEQDLPQVLMRFQTGGQKTTVQNIGRFFEDLERMAAAIGVEVTNLAGIPFVLNLGAVASRKAGTRFPVVQMAVDGPLTAALTARRADAELAGGSVEVELLPESTETDSEESRALDIADTEPSKPGQPGSLPLFEER